MCKGNMRYGGGPCWSKKWVGANGKRKGVGVWYVGGYEFRVVVFWALTGGSVMRAVVSGARRMVSEARVVVSVARAVVSVARAVVSEARAVVSEAREVENELCVAVYDPSRCDFLKARVNSLAFAICMFNNFHCTYFYP